jgi:hypothetical protein
VKLPLKSNLYPDTFAIYWSDNQVKKEGVRLKGRLTVSINCVTIFDDPVFLIDPSPDTLIAVLITDYRTSEKFLITPRFGSNNLEIGRMRFFVDEYMLNLISKTPKIDALRDLVATKPTINNFLLLAEAFEDRQCYVNAYYIYYRIMLDDAQTGEKYFHQFYQRNFDVLNPRPVGHGAMRR